MINAILSGIMSLVIGLVSVILTPIDLLIDSYLPSLSSALNSISYFFQVACSDIAWVIEAFGIPSTAISILISYWTFKLTVPLLVSTIKLAIKWYHMLVP